MTLDAEYVRLLDEAAFHLKEAHRLIVDACIDRYGTTMGDLHTVCVQLREMVLNDLPEAIGEAQHSDGSPEAT